MARREMLAAALLALAACEGGTTAPDTERVELHFGVMGGANLSRQAPDGPVFQGGAPLVVTGGNGTLSIDDIRLIVAEFSLKGDDEFNECGPTAGDDCDDYDLGAMFVDLPLNGGLVEGAAGDVRAGTYTELEFEVEDLDDDEESATERERIQTVLAQVRQQFPDWPENASMMVLGTFTPTGGAPQPFRVFLQAEIQVETALVPPLVVEEDGGQRTVQILLDPTAVFRQGNNVINLATNVGALEVEIQTGFRAHGQDDDN